MSYDFSVLVLRALGLGDLLTAVPAIRGLRRLWPHAELVLAAPEPVAGLLVHVGVVDSVLPTAGLAQVIGWGRGKPPDVAVNLHGAGPQSHHRLLDLAPRRMLAFACDGAEFADGPAWCAKEHEVDRWCRLVRRAGGLCTREDLRIGRADSWDCAKTTGQVVVHPGAAAPARRWPAERWATVVRELSLRGHTVAVTGVAAEADLCAEVVGGSTMVGKAPAVENWCGRTDLTVLTGMVSAARLVLCGDTGVAHLATACGTRSVLLFGSTSPAMWGPAIDPERHWVLWHPHAQDPPGNPHGADVDVRLSRITVEEVLQAAEGVLDR